MPLPWDLPCGDVLRKRRRGLQAHAQLHRGAQATDLRRHAFDLAAVHPQTIAQASMANGACSFMETAQNAGLAFGGKICVGHIDVEGDLGGPSREESAQRSETATSTRHLAASRANVPGEIISNQPVRADGAFQQIPEVWVHHFVDRLLIQ